MYCPQCEGEYREGIEMCPTCEVALVADLAEAPAPAPEPMPARLASAWVDLVGYVDEAEARSARAVLKAAGVTCELVIREAFGPRSGDAGDEFHALSVQPPLGVLHGVERAAGHYVERGPSRSLLAGGHAGLRRLSKEKAL